MTTLNPGLILLASGCRAALVTSLWWVGVTAAAAAGLAAPQAPRSSEPPLAVAAPLADREAKDTPCVTHVRPLSPRAATLLDDGAARSATVARLLDTLDHSDLFVHVETGYLKLPSQLRFAAATHAGRFVRITLNVQELDDRLIAWLAHELQHAVEVAGAPAVISPATLVRFYEKHGERAVAEGLCTREAQKVASLVLAEVGATRSGRK